MDGYAQRAARLLAATAAMQEAADIDIGSSQHEDTERVSAAVRAYLSKDVFAAAWAEGQAMTMDQTIAYALNECK
jgi:hypothetical protein